MAIPTRRNGHVDDEGNSCQKRSNGHTDQREKWLYRRRKKQTSKKKRNGPVDEEIIFKKRRNGHIDGGKREIDISRGGGAWPWKRSKKQLSGKGKMAIQTEEEKATQKQEMAIEKEKMPTQRRERGHTKKAEMAISRGRKGHTGIRRAKNAPRRMWCPQMLLAIQSTQTHEYMRGVMSLL